MHLHASPAGVAPESTPHKPHGSQSQNLYLKILPKTIGIVILAWSLAICIQLHIFECSNVFKIRKQRW